MSFTMGRLLNRRVGGSYAQFPPICSVQTVENVLFSCQIAEMSVNLPEMAELDPTDKELLALLRTDARESVSALARKLDLARSTVQERIARLERTGVIAGYTIRSGENFAERQIAAHVMISVDPKMAASVTADLKKMPEVRSLAAISGTFDMMAEVADETTAKIDAVLDAIGRLKGVQKTMSSIVLSLKFER
jgi:DNA-binding Lrp family transcriptional regulator